MGLGLVAALLAFAALDLDRYLSLEYLRSRQADLAALLEQSPWTVRAGYFGLYLAVASLSLPGAAVLTLAGGALFGMGWGLLLVSFASSLGATVSFLAARFVLRDAVRRRLGPRLSEIDAGLEREGAFYLLSLRLIPVLPFFLVNLAMGLTGLRTWTYYWVSQLGMLAGTALYVHAGTRLAELRSLSDVASPGLLGALALLGLFPLLARSLLRPVQEARWLRPWRALRPRRFDRNLVVIGAGAAGLVSAYIAAALKARVTLVEAGAMGGDCLNTGCVPSKTLIRSARALQAVRDAGRYGINAHPASVDWAVVTGRIAGVIRAIEPHDSVERYRSLGVDVLQGQARITSPWTVEVHRPDGQRQTLSTRAIVVAAGARPIVPDLPGLPDGGCLTSETLWQRLAELPGPPPRLVVLGGGPIGCELAQALARLGSRVSLVEQAPQVLPREDEDVGQAAARALQEAGVQLLLGRQALRCERAADGTRQLIVQALGAAPGSAEQALPLDELLCAVGRSARLQGYGLEALGIPADGRTLPTDAFLQTACPTVYAAGDVAGPYQFTHAAAHQAWYATVNALFGGLRRFRVDHSTLPGVTFLEPEIARVGLNEREARMRGIPFEVTRYELDELDRAIADGRTAGFVKVLTVPGRDRILGATVVAEHAGELLAEWTLAMREGLGLSRILGTVHPYPTWGEANKALAGRWRQSHAPQGLLRGLQRIQDWRRG
ncbi:MAG: pyridine nucleotide-disulfide oxidoreductase [Rhodoferax sp.]|nr:pyridine nucleotide-disulfide oxidoreductase [Rhodoferax sp.]